MYASYDNFVWWERPLITDTLWGESSDQKWNYLTMGQLDVIGSDNGLSPVWQQAII